MNLSDFDETDFVITTSYIEESNWMKATSVFKPFLVVKDIDESKESFDRRGRALTRLGHTFRCLDDDGVHYYTGKSADDSSFAPLDEYAGPNAGCTSIQYRNAETGKWETL